MFITLASDFIQQCIYMAKNNNKINKNAITKEQHKAQNLVFIGYAFTVISIILIFFHKTLSTIILFISFAFISFAILFVYTSTTLKNSKFRLRYLSILVVFSLAMVASAFSIFLTAASITNVSEALVVATTISILIDIEFYKHMKEHILKMLKDQKTKRDLRQQLDAISVTFGPIIASTSALFIALLVLMDPLFLFSILFVDLSILLILFALVMPIELFAEDLLIQAHYFES